MTTTTTNRGYFIQGTGDNPNSWGADLNDNFDTIDNNISALTTIATTGGTTTLTGTQAESLVYNITGTLTSQATIVFPFSHMFFLVINSTSGSFSVVLSASGGGQTVTIPGGAYNVYWSDGTNVFAFATQAPSVPSGSILSFLQSTAPTGWSQSSGYNDQVIRLVSGTGGGGTGGSWTFNFNADGAALSAAQIPPHTHNINLPTGQPGSFAVGSIGGTLANGNAFTTDSGSGLLGLPHIHGLSGSTNWRPAYVNAIVCVKS